MGLLGRGFEVLEGSGALASAPLRGPLLLNFALGLAVDLVAEDHKGKVVRVVGACLVHELRPPHVQPLEGLGIRDVIYEYTCIGAAVESHTKRLESLLPGRVPDLRRGQRWQVHG